MSSFTPPQVVICDFIYSVYLCPRCLFPCNEIIKLSSKLQKAQSIPP